MPKKITKMLYQYDDGSSEYLEGEDAVKAADWLNSCQTLAYIHGSVYTGPKMISVPAEVK